MNALPQRKASVVASDLRWDLMGPCSDCPFRRDAPEHEGICSSIVGYVELIERGEFVHSCHKTDNRADGPKNHDGPIQHCGGALMFLFRANRSMQRPLIQAAEAGRLDVHAAAARAKREDRVFRSVRALVNFYAKMAARIMARRKRDPLVYVVGKLEVGGAEQVRLSKSKGRDLIQCGLCTRPAVVLDHHWPFHIDQCRCAVHAKPDDVEQLAQRAPKGGS